MKYICGCSTDDSKDCADLKRHGFIRPKIHKHTPTPWKVDQRECTDHFGNSGLVQVLDSQEDTIVEVLPTEDEGDAGARANADFIVTAVNSHERLLAAAKELLEYLDCGDDERNIEAAQKSLAAEIAKAEKGA